MEKDVIRVVKDVGRIDDIDARADLTSLHAMVGVAHTRWATHGGVTQKNAHPHLSCGGGVAVVHNGIIDNHASLRSELESEGHVFVSETDTEVIPHLIERALKKGFSPMDAFTSAVRQLRGSFAMLTLIQRDGDAIYAARKDAPLIIGLGKGRNFAASDILAFIQHTDRVVFLDNLEVAEIRRDKVTFFDFDGGKIVKTPSQVAWEASEFSRADYAHYTLKEIKEQPYVVTNTLTQDEDLITRFGDTLRDADRVYITGSGTSYHAGLIAKQLFARFLRKPAETIIASEFEQQLELIAPGDIILAVSQSGETADVLQAIRKAKDKGAKILSVVNAPGSSLIRESDLSLPLRCGPEVGVAATKSFTSQLALLYFLTLKITDKKRETAELTLLGSSIRETLGVEPLIRDLTSEFSEVNDFYFIGRGLHYPIALEGALKLKELSYVHAEGFPAGELKHGTLALVEQGTTVFAINPSDETREDTLNNAAEMKARGAKIIGVSDVNDPSYDRHIKITSAPTLLYPLIEVIPLQLFAYYMALVKQRNPDFPRNLAKSVTVK